MLKMIHGAQDRDLRAAHTTAGEAGWPVPFPSVLEYNSPAHGPWNIVHMGMLIPGAHQIYVCADNCNRGVILTAAEMGAQDRFSNIAVSEDDLINGHMEELIIDGVGEVLASLEKKPSVVLLFTVCLHHFLGTDLNYIYSELRSRHPDQIFIDSYMDCILQKDGLTPDQKLRIGMYKCLEKRPLRPDQINIIGNDLPMNDGSELLQMAADAGISVKDITRCASFAEYMTMSESFLNISTYPNARPGCEVLSRRLGQTSLYLPQCFGYDEIENELRSFAEAIHAKTLPDFASLRAMADEALFHAQKIAGSTPVAVDYTAFPRVLGLSRLLLEHGFNVVRIYADAFSGEEEEDFKWLAANHPDTEIYATIHPDMRVMPRGWDGKLLAVGQKAAYFTQSPYFVNLVEGGGLYGFNGIRSLCGLMEEAIAAPKEIEDNVVRKGLGCLSCIDI